MFFSRFVGTIQRSSIEPLTFPRYLPPRFLPLYYSNKHLRRAAATVSRCEATRESLPPIFPVSVQITIHPNFLRSRAFIRSCAILAELETSVGRYPGNHASLAACTWRPIKLETGYCLLYRPASSRQTEIRNEFRCSRKRGRPYPSSSLFRRWFNDEGEKRRVELCPWMKGETNLRRGCKRGILKSNAERL